MTSILEETIKTCFLTAHLLEHDPISLLLVAAPESGKTTIILKNPCHSAIAITDITGRGLQKLCTVKPEIRHIIINDLIAVSSHKPSVSQYTMAMLNAMTEEGIQTVVTPETIEKFEKSSGRRAIISSITIDILRDGRKWWNKIGFTSRMLPFSYRLSSSTVIAIKSKIDGDVKRSTIGEEIPIPKSIRPILFSDAMAKECRFISDERSHQLGEIGIRRLKQYRAMTRAHALLFGRHEVCKIDIDFIAAMDKFVSFTECREVEL